MHAAMVRAFGDPPRFGLYSDPIPEEGEVLVQVTSAALHPVVKALADGTHYGSPAKAPFIPGIDGTGRLHDGTRVYFGSRFGSFAERSRAMSRMCVKIPDGVDDATAAAIVNPGMSSWMALSARAQFVAGESVLVLGATGIAGQLAVQIAKRMGAMRVIAVGRNPRVLGTLKALGADALISLQQEREALISAFRHAWEESGVDVVLDYLWGSPAEAVLEAISQRGLQKAKSPVRFIQIGESAGRTVSLQAETLRSSGLLLMGSGSGSASLDALMKAVGVFFRSAAEAPFRCPIETVPLRDVETVWNSEQRGRRVVFKP